MPYLKLKPIIMKKLFFIAILSCNFLNAQSNLFPAAGNVGIGTTAPLYKLSLASDLPGYTTGMRPNGGLGLFATNVIDLNAHFGWVRKQNTDPILLLQGVQDAVAWRDVAIARDGGNVGVGTDSPAAKLDVNGSAFIADKAVPRYSWTERSASTVFTDNIRPYTDRGFRIYDGDSRSHLSLEAHVFAEIQAYTTTGAESNAVDIPGTESHLFLNPRGGNVGVGTNAPYYKLSLASDLPAYSVGMRPSGGLGLFTNNVANLNGQLGWVRKPNADPVLLLQGVQDAVAWRDVAIAKDGGNVGVGTDSPVAKLDVNGSAFIADKAVPRYSMTERSASTVFTDNIRPYTDRGFRIYDGDSRSHLSLEAHGFAEIQAYTTTGAESNAVDISGTESNLHLNPRGGNVGIGTVNPGYKLDVIGTIRAREVRVNLDGADFVFEDGYKLMPLNELEKFVKQNKHLPEIAPAKEMQEKGSDLGGLAVQLLQKIEELTLHVIEQNKHINEQDKEMALLKEKVRKLEQK